MVIGPLGAGIWHVRWVKLMVVDAYKASIAIRIMSDTRDEEKDRNKNKD